MLEELRSLPPPPNARISNVDGGPVYDGRLPRVSSGYGPFDLPAEFSKFVRGGIEMDPDWTEDIKELINLQVRQWPL